MTLAGLARPAVRDLVSERLGGQALSERLVDEVLGLTGGNPFLVIKWRTCSRPPGQRRSRPGHAPGPSRGTRAPPPTPRAALASGAPIAGDRVRPGARVRSPLLATVAGSSPEAVLEGLAAPLALSLVREVPARCADTASRIPSCARRCTETWRPRPRLRCTARWARHSRRSGPADECRLPTLAHHFFHAARAGDATKAIRYGIAAGERALELLAFEEAIRHFDHALAALVVAGDDALRLRALMGLGEAVRGAGDPVRSEAAFRDAMHAVADRVGPHALAETGLRFATSRAEASVLDVEVNELLERALTVLPYEITPLRARLLARLAAGLVLQPGAEAVAGSSRTRRSTWRGGSTTRRPSTSC